MSQSGSPLVPSLLTASTPPSATASIPAVFSATQSEINQVSASQYVPTRIAADEVATNHIQSCFIAESVGRAQHLRRIFLPLMPKNLECMPHNAPDHDHPGGGYGGLVGQRLNGTLLKLVHAMDEKLPVTDECLSLMLQSAEAYFER